VDPRQKLEEIRDFLLWEIKQHNETLKHVLLAIGEVDRPRSLDPDDDLPDLELDETQREEERKRTRDELSTHYRPPSQRNPHKHPKKNNRQGSRTTNRSRTSPSRLQSWWS